MLSLLGVLIFFGGLLASIALHEIGHLVPAKKFGVKVPQGTFQRHRRRHCLCHE
jgi:Zn-dependent protease